MWLPTQLGSSAHQISRGVSRLRYLSRCYVRHGAQSHMASRPCWRAQWGNRSVDVAAEAAEVTSPSNQSEVTWVRTLRRRRM
jgi:hypothetical protein